MTWAHGDRHGQRGLALVEAAVVLPLILFLMLVVAELGRGIFQFNTLHKAVREGAREAAELAVPLANQTLSLTPAEQTRIQNLVACGLPTCTDGVRRLPGFEPAQVSVTPSGNDIAIAAVYTFRPVFAAGIPQFFIGGGGSNVVVGPTLGASATMRGLQ